MRVTLNLRRSSVGKGRKRGAVRLSWLRDESGAVAVITGLCLVVFMTMLALVLDIGHLQAVRSELQNAADAGALAGAQALFAPAPSGRRLVPITGAPQCGVATGVAQGVANTTDNQVIAIASGDVQMGHWGWPGEVFPLNQFVPQLFCSINVNAIRVMTRKDENLNQPVTTWFARVFGIDTVDVTSRPAVAALGYVGGVSAGRAFPIAVNNTWLRQVLAQPMPADGVRFNPDGQDNGGWCSPQDETPSAANLKDWINSGFPERITFDNLINLNNGTVDSAMQEVKQQLAGHTQTYHLADGTAVPGWLVLAPVVEKDKINQTTPVVAFQPMIITSVDAKGSPKTIQVVFYDQPVLVDGGIPGGSRSNLFAGLPRLVQ